MQTVKLASGRSLSSIGLGFWKIDRDKTASIAKTAIELGYRHFDCASDYGNEAEVGEGIQSAVSAGLIQRDDLWVTSKLWNTYHRAEHVRRAAEKSLRDLQLDVLDLYLIHFPIAQKYVPIEDRYPPEWFYDPDAEAPRVELDNVPIIETWRAMEQLVKDGLVKEIGVCNFGVSLLRDLINQAEIKPAMLQVELHPFLTQQKLLRFCQQESIAVTGFSPLGAQSYFELNMAEQSESLLENAQIKSISQQHEKTPAQVALRWGIQRGTAIVPKSSHRDRLRENLALFDFELSADEMASIDQLNMNRRFNDPGDFAESAFHTFLPIYE